MDPNNRGLGIPTPTVSRAGKMGQPEKRRVQIHLQFKRLRVRSRVCGVKRAPRGSRIASSGATRGRLCQL